MIRVAAIRAFARSYVYPAIVICALSLGGCTLQPFASPLQSPFGSPLTTPSGQDPLSVTQTAQALFPESTYTPIFVPNARPTSLPVPFRSPTPRPTLIPPIDPSMLPDQLQASIVVRSATGSSGHSLQRVTGWSSGMRSSVYVPFQWLDDSHLLLYPLTGQEEGMGIEEQTLPVVVNLIEDRI